MNAGLTLPTPSKPRPASRSCSAPPAGSPRRMRSRALLSRRKSTRSLSRRDSRKAMVARAAVASSSLPCSISASARKAEACP